MNGRNAGDGGRLVFSANHSAGTYTGCAWVGCTSVWFWCSGGDRAGLSLWPQEHVGTGGGGGLLTLTFGRVTQPFLEIDMIHEVSFGENISNQGPQKCIQVHLMVEC